MALLCPLPLEPLPAEPCIPPARVVTPLPRKAPRARARPATGYGHRLTVPPSRLNRMYMHMHARHFGTMHGFARAGAH